MTRSTFVRPARAFTAKGAATRARIVEVASGLMLSQGVARTTIEQVQHEAGVSASQLYHYFADKRDLVDAVIDDQAEQVLALHRASLEPVRDVAGLRRWRDAVVAVVAASQCAGGCPIGSLASELAEVDPVARARLAKAFAEWERLLTAGFRAMREDHVLPPGIDAARLGLGLLAAVQGGLLLSQVRRDLDPLTAALDTVIDYVAALARTAQ